jgi:hypothetical protein
MYGSWDVSCSIMQMENVGGFNQGIQTCGFDHRLSHKGRFGWRCDAW